MKEINFSLVKSIYAQMADRMDGFYLAGGTALSMCYFQHRASYDLDFFTQSFSQKRIKACVDDLAGKINGTIELVEQNLGDDFAKIMVYRIALDDGGLCKLDFVEDSFALMNRCKRVDGVDVLSLEDIYIRKIAAIAGTVQKQGIIGKDMMVGGRQEAKDLYDIYILSSIFLPLSTFVKMIQAKPVMIEGIIQWYQLFDRMQMKTGLLDLITAHTIDYRSIDEHLKEQIDLILDQEIGGIA